MTLELAALAFLIANLIALPLGALAACFHQRKADLGITFMATIMGAIPNFWLATLLIMLFALTLRWLPAGGYVAFTEAPLRNLSLMVMPALSLGIVSSALLLRIMRSAMLEVLSSDYIRTALAKGASQRDGDLAPRAAQRADPVPDRRRRRVRLPVRRRRDHRGHVPVARNRLARAGRDHQSRLPGPARGAPW